MVPALQGFPRLPRHGQGDAHRFRGASPTSFDLAQSARSLAAHWPVVVVVALALLLRTTSLFPVSFYGDDAEYAGIARSLAADPRALSYPDLEHLGPRPFVSQPPLVLYIFALADIVTGNPEAGPVLASVALGTLTVAVVYAIGCLLRDRATGAFCGLMLAVLPQHVALSRGGFLDVGLGFFLALAVLTALWWSAHPTRNRALLLGAATAAAAMSKLPGILVVVPVGAVVLWEVWQRRARAAEMPEEERRRFRRGLAWMAVPPAAALGAYLALLAHLEALSNFARKLGWQAARVASTTEESASALPNRPLSWYLTDPGFGLAAQVGVPALLLAIAGAAILLFTPRERRGAALGVLLWPAVLFGFFSLSSRKEGFYIVPALPGIALLVGVALGYGFGSVLSDARVKTASGKPSLSGARAVAVLGVVALVLSALAAGPPAMATMAHLERGKTYGAGLEDAARLIHDQDPDAGQIGTLQGRFALHFYNGQPTFSWFTPHEATDEAIRAGEVRYLVQDSYFNFPAERDWMRGLVTEHHGTLVAKYGPKAETVRVWVYEFKPSATAAPAGNTSAPSPAP